MRSTSAFASLVLATSILSVAFPAQGGQALPGGGTPCDVPGAVVFQSTLDGVPGSPYRAPDPVIQLYGWLSQCGSVDVRVNGEPVDDFSLLDATWEHAFTLQPGDNAITLQIFDGAGDELERLETHVFYALPLGPLRLWAPSRMVATKTLTLAGEIYDHPGSAGQIDWRLWHTLGTVSARRSDDGSAVPISITVFETLAAGAGGGAPPPDSIRFYNGVGSVSLTLDDPASAVGAELLIEVRAAGRYAARTVTVLPDVPASYTPLSGTLAGANLDWGPEDGVIHLTGDTTVPSGATLTIAPGTLVMVDAGPRNAGTVLSVSGSVHALGTPEQPIFFFPTAGPAALALPQTTSNNEHAWRGIYHYGGATSRYAWTFLTGAGNGAISGHPRAPVMRFDGGHSLDMAHFVAADLPGKVLHVANGGGRIDVSRSLFSRCGIGVEIFGSPEVAFTDTWFTRIGRAPEANQVDGDILHLDGRGIHRVDRCVLTDGGDDVIDGASSVRIYLENSIVYDTRDKLLSLKGCCGNLYNVLAFGLGGGFEQSGGVVDQTTFGLNRTFSTGYPYTIEKTILWPGSVPTCSGNVSYSSVGSASHLGCGAGNIAGNPRFANPAQNDYSLLSYSPALTAGPSGERIGWLDFPYGQTCANDAQCNDGNPCTTDVCRGGACAADYIDGCLTCSTDRDCDYGNGCVVGSCGVDGRCAFAATNEGQLCDDGWACTAGDRCTAGVCVGTEDCAVGAACDPEAGGRCQGTLHATFQDGVDGYAGTADTTLRQASPSTVFGAQATFNWDTSDGNPAGMNVGLLRFDGLFGAGPGQIPLGVAITAATLTLRVTDASDPPAAGIYSALVPWSEATATFANFGDDPGVQADELGALVAYAPVTIGTFDIDLTSAIQAAAAAPESHHGFVLLPASPNGLSVASSEAGDPAQRPTLRVRYATACTGDAACDDGQFCNGLERCNLATGRCEAALVACPGQACDEANDRCVGCLTAGDCDDGDFCNGAEICVAGQCQGATPPTCDDGVACTLDSCDSALGCRAVDGCGFGSACDLGSGVCLGVAETLIPAGATWAYRDLGTDPGPGWAAVGYDDGSWARGSAQLGYGDGDEQTVVSYGPNAGAKFPTTYFRHTFELPAGVGIEQLTLRVLRDDGVVVYLNGIEVFRDNMPSGSPGYLTYALRAASDETTFLQASVDPALLRAGANVIAAEIHQNSAGSSDLSFDLALEANVGCSGDGDCDDGNACNGSETCVARACVAGVPPDCTDGIVCTGETCDPEAGCTYDDLCGAGFGCNPANGQCEAVAAPPAPPLPIQVGNDWTFFKGRSAPTPADPLAWTAVTFDDSSWLVGPGGFGYGTDCAPYGTVLSDMQGSYLSIYARRTFSLADPAAIADLTLWVDYDDGFVAYLNGVEVVRGNMPTGSVSHTTQALGDRECSRAASPNPAGLYALSSLVDLRALLRPGLNVLAIQGTNRSLWSSDFTLAVSLTPTLAP